MRSAASVSPSPKSGMCTPGNLAASAGASGSLRASSGAHVPRLAGQSIDYLRKTMRNFHDGARGNNPWMAALLKTLTERDIDALAHYLGGL
jgi:cytochrome c553